MGRLKLVSVTNSRRGNDDGALSYGAQKDLLLHDTGPIMVGERVIHLAGGQANNGSITLECLIVLSLWNWGRCSYMTRNLRLITTSCKYS